MSAANQDLLTTAGKVTILSTDLGSDLCSVDFDKYLPGYWAFTNRISIWISIWRMQPLTHNFGATAYTSSLAGTHLLPGPEKQCSMNCLAQGHNEPEHRQIVEPESWPGCWSRVPHANTRPTRQLNADRDYLNMIGSRQRIYHVQLSWWLSNVVMCIWYQQDDINRPLSCRDEFIFQRRISVFARSNINRRCDGGDS